MMGFYLWAFSSLAVGMLAGANVATAGFGSGASLPLGFVLGAVFGITIKLAARSYKE